MRIALVGCGHGELDSIYASVAQIEAVHQTTVDLLLICGDFQAVRNQSDLATMACPAKYRSMQDFHRYYSGEKRAPVLTIFIGGNHEASSHLWELYYGGWVAPNIYFLGYAGVVSVGGVRIGGLSGIYNGRHYHTGHCEAPPYSDSDMRSAYHVREIEVLRLLQLRQPMDVFLSHDWPAHIATMGDTNALLRKKSFLRDEVRDGSLGSPAGEQLLKHLKPDYWFAAHLHVKFAAVVQHAAGASATRFLSLDKCLPQRDFMQLITVDGDGSPPVLRYDAEWIAVLRSTAHLFSNRRGRVPLDPQAVGRASGGRADFGPSEEELSSVLEAAGGDLAVPLDFAVTAPPYQHGDPPAAQPHFAESPQTAAFARTFELPAEFRSQAGGTSGPAVRDGRGLHGVDGGLCLPVPPPPPTTAADGVFAPLPVDEEIDLGDD